MFGGGFKKFGGDGSPPMKKIKLDTPSPMKKNSTGGGDDDEYILGPLKDGETAQVVSMSNPNSSYTVKRAKSYYTCSCPAFKGAQNSGIPWEMRSCKHLVQYRGQDREDARIKAAADRLGVAVPEKKGKAAMGKAKAKAKAGAKAAAPAAGASSSSSSSSSSAMAKAKSPAKSVASPASAKASAMKSPGKKGKNTDLKFLLAETWDGSSDVAGWW